MLFTIASEQPPSLRPCPMLTNSPSLRQAKAGEKLLGNRPDPSRVAVKDLIQSYQKYDLYVQYIHILW